MDVRIITRLGTLSTTGLSTRSGTRCMYDMVGVLPFGVLAGSSYQGSAGSRGINEHTKIPFQRHPTTPALTTYHSGTTMESQEMFMSAEKLSSLFEADASAIIETVTNTKI